jgi:hypothetical protein
MGQQQNTNMGAEPTEGKHAIHQPLKNRFGAKFQTRTTNVVNPKATGDGRDTGHENNPGKPV